MFDLPLRRRLDGRILVLLVLALFASTPWGTTAQDAEIPEEVAANATAWPMANGDYGNTRVAIDAAINSDNVNDLGVAWTFDIPGRSNFGSAATAPLILDGVVYFQDLESNTFALDLETGDVIWEQMYGASVLGPNGPAVGYGNVYVATSDATFAALDMATGEENWSIDVPAENDVGPAGAFQPYVYDGIVYLTTGTGGYTGGVSGHIFALNANTGDIVWEFQTVEEGFWGNPEVNSGAGIWYPPAIDTETGMSFWGTGNPAPFPGTVEFPNGSSREEPNLYANSLVALSHDNGELVWYNYVKPNDMFDLDFQAPPILATVTMDGEEREIVVGSGKLGRIIAFDRDSGEILWDTSVGMHHNDELLEIRESQIVTVFPGFHGGVETPMALADGTVYAAVLNRSSDFSADAFGAEDGTEALNAAAEHSEVGSGTGELVALDAATGELLWTHVFDSEIYGGATVVNDLVFTATFDGMIYALDRETGDEVWSYQSPAAINAWPAVAGDTIIWPAGFGGTPSLIALRLGAEMPAEAAPPPSPVEEEEQAGSEFVAIDEANQTVRLTVIAAFEGVNGGYNFNGHARGDARFIVPEGWTVEVEFSNASQLPHSAMVVTEDAVEETTLPGPVFEGAATRNPYAGTTQSETFLFVASEAGIYALACAVPGHATQGQWIYFEVSPSDAEPAFVAEEESE